MSLKQYKSKRDLGITPEPKAKVVKKKAKRALTFVVQKHAASHLHYDFRLELDGVLKSWAVPKGPPEEPGIKRLAIHVEDHPLAYGSFEGTIPKGNYGAGTVEIWDHGTYTVIGKDAHEQLRNGELKFSLEGKKLHGDYVLVQLKNAPKDNQWLLIKKSEAESSQKKKAINLTS